MWTDELVIVAIFRLNRPRIYRRETTHPLAKQGATAVVLKLRALTCTFSRKIENSDEYEVLIYTMRNSGMTQFHRSFLARGVAAVCDPAEPVIRWQLMDRRSGNIIE